MKMSNYSEDDIKRAAEVREWLVKIISDKQDEVIKLRTALSLIDKLLKQGSFKIASNLASSVSQPLIQGYSEFPKIGPTATSNQEVRNDTTNIITEKVVSGNQAQTSVEPKELKQLKRIKDDLLLANVEVLSSSLEIAPAKGIYLNVNTPPFKSFFLNRILDGMKTKDREKVTQGHIKESEALNYDIEEEENGIIGRILINNYREKERLNEIFNTSTWVFTRMIEKSSKL
jgi:light-regulated signal transduction histidine kinase (bacteriophytochrome)